MIEPLPSPHRIGSRPDWDEYFMRFAGLAAQRATCPRKQVGAVIVQDRRIVATGYNGSPPGMPHCIDPGVGCLLENHNCIRTLHAEQNALLQAAQHGVSTRGATIYVTWRPCHICARMIAGAGITRVLYDAAGGHPSEWARAVLDGSAIRVSSLERIPDTPALEALCGRAAPLPKGEDSDDA